MPYLCGLSIWLLTNTHMPHIFRRRGHISLQSSHIILPVFCWTCLCVQMFFSTTHTFRLYIGTSYLCILNTHTHTHIHHGCYSCWDQVAEYRAYWLQVGYSNVCPNISATIPCCKHTHTCTQTFWAHTCAHCICFLFLEKLHSHTPQRQPNLPAVWSVQSHTRSRGQRLFEGECQLRGQQWHRPPEFHECKFANTVLYPHNNRYIFLY